MWSGSTSGPVSEGYIEEWAEKKYAYTNGDGDGRYAKEDDALEINSNKWENQLNESLERELRQILLNFSEEDTFLVNEFKPKYNELEKSVTEYEKNKCGLSGNGSTNVFPMKPGIYKILMICLVILMWLIQIFPFRSQLSTLYSFFFAGLVSIVSSVAGHITGRLFCRAKRNENQILGMVILMVTLSSLIGLYGYLWWKSEYSGDTFLIIGAGTGTILLFSGMIYASYMSGDPDPVCNEIKKNLNELTNDLDRIHRTRRQNESDKNCSIKKFIDRAQELIQEYRHAYEKAAAGRKYNWPAFPDMSDEFTCKIKDAYFDKWESRSQNLTA